MNLMDNVALIENLNIENKMFMLCLECLDNILSMFNREFRA